MDSRDRVIVIGSVSDHLEARAPFQELCESVAEELMIIGDDDAMDHRALANTRLSGSSTRTAVPELEVVSVRLAPTT